MQKMTHEGSPLESAIFTPLSRIGWTSFLCMLVYACLMGYGGPVNWFLSLPQWKPFARLSYAIYLIHMPIMMMEAASLHRPQYFSARTTVSLWNNNFVVYFFNFQNRVFSVVQIFRWRFCYHITKHICNACSGISNGYNWKQYIQWQEKRKSSTHHLTWSCSKTTTFSSREHINQDK